ncbi:MAG: hypothetical protein AB7J34_01980 [Limisphaerales bacterium]
MDALVAIGFAVAAAVLLKLPVLFGLDLDRHEGFYVRNASLFVLPLLAGYFAWKRGLSSRAAGWLAGAVCGAIIFANAYPFQRGGHTGVLTALNLPVALWLVVGVAWAGGRWDQVAVRMEFIRFSGEGFIHYVLIALGGGVFTGILAVLFNAIGIRPDAFIQQWLVPCGAVGAVVIAAWLVEARQGLIGNLAPMLTRLFTPLFAALLLTFLWILSWTGRGLNIERDMLIAFDLLLVVVLGLLLYSISARDPGAPRGFHDGALVLMVVSALLVDGVALWAIVARITEFGFSPNRVAGLGVNGILLVNLAWSAVLYVRFLRGRGSFASLEKWQTDYLPVYSAWAALVVIVFPPLFRYA